jgi:hypothetical protein
MSWFRKFDEPIPLPNGQKLLTLSEAADFIIGLPPEIIALPDWQIALAALGQNVPTSRSMTGLTY